MAAHSSTLDILQAAFPKRVSLTPKEIAQVLHGEDRATKKRIESVNRALDEGRLVPGLRKDGPRWRVPIVAFAKALDRRTQAVASPEPVAGRRSRHSTIGPRMLFAQARSNEVMNLILQELRALAAADQQTQLEADTAPASGPSRRGPFL